MDLIIGLSSIFHILFSLVRANVCHTRLISELIKIDLLALTGAELLIDFIILVLIFYPLQYLFSF
jgi:hypothetical protein